MKKLIVLVMLLILSINALAAASILDRKAEKVEDLETGKKYHQCINKGNSCAVR